MSHDESFVRAIFNAAATRTYRTAVSAGLTTPDREDLYQAIVLDARERAGQYDPTKGSPGTFTGVVSEHCATDFIVALKRDRSRLSFFAAQDAANDDEVSPFPGGSFESAVPMWADDADLFADTETLHDLQSKSLRHGKRHFLSPRCGPSDASEDVRHSSGCLTDQGRAEKTSPLGR